MHDELARRTCTRLAGFPDAEASVNALLEKRISADEAMNAWTGGLEAAWTARNDPGLHAQLLLAYGRNGPLVGPWIHGPCAR